MQRIKPAAQAGRAQLLDRLLPFALVARGDGDGRPGMRQAARHAEAKPAIAAGHDRHAAAQVEWVQGRLLFLLSA